MNRNRLNNLAYILRISTRKLGQDERSRLIHKSCMNTITFLEESAKKALTTRNS